MPKIVCQLVPWVHSARRPVVVVVVALVLWLYPTLTLSVTLNR
jgi:hypothetical protein